MKNRVVITGMGIVAPNGVGLEEFESSIRNGKNGIEFFQELADLNFSCQIGGKPKISPEKLKKYFTDLQLRGLNSSGIIYGVIAGTDAWTDAGLSKSGKEAPDWDSGIIFGTGILGVDKFREAIHLIDAGKTRRLGSTSVLQTMASGISAFLGGILGCGNQVTTNSSACTTGTEALLMGFDRIQSGKAKRMLVGSCSDSGPYVWGGFDAMRILSGNYNNDPHDVPGPMSEAAEGFIPGSGSGALLLEDYDSARKRGARMYAEVLGGEVNSGGHRGGGSMTAANNLAVQRCIKGAIKNSGISAKDIDAINGHLTGTSKDPVEIENWILGLDRKNEDFPYINSLKGLTGHCLSASGSIECVASVLQLYKNFIFGNVNCNSLHSEIKNRIAPQKIPRSTLDIPLNIIAKASFGFGDVNGLVIFKKMED